MQLLNFVIARLKEPSSYLGLAALLAAVHLCTDCTTLAASITSIGIGAAGIAAIFFPE